MRPIFEILGMVGIGLSVVAYLPQMSHLTKERCSAGISLRAWSMWLASSFLVGTLAVYRQDYVFITLAITSLLSSTTILLLARRYRGTACASHGYGTIESRHQFAVIPDAGSERDQEPESGSLGVLPRPVSS